MKHIKFQGTDVEASRIALGCMRIYDLSEKEVDILINTCVESGINFFDHADIYGGGNCEEIFGGTLKRNKPLRDKIYIQSKCAIHNGMYDFSKEHITKSVDGILKRLGVERLDFLLLHRPDTLVEPEEIAETFDLFERGGKVRWFGVSNQNPMQIELLQKYVKQRLMINQLQFSITNASMVGSGFNVNTEFDAAVDRDGSILDYCRLKDITIQPWSPFQHGFFAGSFIDNPEFAGLNDVMDSVAQKYGITKSALAIAWILRHPAKMQPIIGTTNIERIKNICMASDIDISRDEWYDIFKAAGNRLP